MTFPSTKTNILKVPPSFVQPPPKKYEPVDCDFTDELEHVSVKKINVLIKYWNPDETRAEITGLITDIYTENGEEYLVVSTGHEIRLDRLIELQIVSK